MAFDMYKTHKLADQLESDAYEHCEWAIKSFYGLELEENEYGYEQNVYEVLNEEQITEIEAYVDEWSSPDDRFVELQRFMSEVNGSVHLRDSKGKLRDGAKPVYSKKSWTGKVVPRRKPRR